MMLRRRSQLKKKRRIQFLIVFSLFLLVLLFIIFLFKRGKSDISLTLTGENLLSWSQLLSGEGQLDLSWVQQVSMLSWNWITKSSTSVSNGNGSWVSSWTVALAQEKEKNHFFSIQVCNRIVDFYSCVIKNAPLENQSAMEKSLEQTLQPWKLMADTQLREACEAVVKNDTFQEVKNHYTQSGTNYGCVF